MDSVKAAVRQFVVTEIVPGETPESLKDDTQLIQSGIIDSISVLKLVAFLESAFSIQVEAVEVTSDNLETLNLIEQFVKRKKG